jgi:hypothetical protein
VNAKRVAVATGSGALMGVICYLGGRFGLKDEINAPMLAYIMVNRTLIGFVIGLSTVPLHWALHGAMMGVVVGLPFAVGCLLEPDNLETALAALVLGAVYGLLIELLTSVMFGARQVRIERKSWRAEPSQSA